MKKSRFTESQIVKALKEYEAGKSSDDICRELGVNRATFYNWRKKYGGMEPASLNASKSSKKRIAS